MCTIYIPVLGLCCIYDFISFDMYGFVIKKPLGRNELLIDYKEFEAHLVRRFVILDGKLSISYGLMTVIISDLLSL